MTRHFDEHLAPSGLTIARYSLLTTLERLGTPTLPVYARDLAMDRTTLLRNLRPLIEAGLITVGPAPAGRAGVARLTARGSAALRRAKPYWRSAQEALTGKVSGDEVERVLALAAALSG